MLLNAVSGAGVVLYSGTGLATIKCISVNHGKASEVDFQKIISASLAMAIIGGSILAIAIVIIFNLFGNVFFQKMGNIPLIKITGYTAALLIIIEQIDNVYSATIRGLEKFGYIAKIEMLSKAIQFSGIILVIEYSKELEVLYITLVIVSILRLALKYFVVKKLLNISNCMPRLKGVSEIMHYAKWGWIQGLGAMIYGVSDRLIVGSVLGASSLATYSIATQLAQQIHACSAAAVSVVFPMISRKNASNKKDEIRKISLLIIKLNFIMCSALSLVIFIFSNEILTLWLGGQESKEISEILRYLVIAFWLLSISVAPHFILLGIGRVSYVSKINLIGGFILIATMYYLVGPYGILGVGIARILYGLITLLNYLPVKNILKR